MRILFLTEERISFSEPLVRGGAIHVRNVVEGLRDRGHDVFLLDWNGRPERPFQLSVDPRSRFVEGAIRTARRASTACRQRDIDVVVSKTRKTYLPGLLAARRRGVPHVVHVGSSLDRPVAGILDRLDMASFVARLRAPHDGYFVVCEHIASQLSARRIDRSRIFDVKNAVDTGRFHPDRTPIPLDDRFRRRLDETVPGTIRLGYVGGLHAYKGLDDFADALSRIGADCSVVIAGDGPERGRLERLFGDDAVFLGSVPYEQVPALYHAMDVFVLPSHTEGLPRVILEAQATATPPVATRVGGVSEVIDDGETGLLCAPNHPQVLAEAIGRLASDPDLRERIGAAARSRVASRYSWERLYDRYESYLGEVHDG
jgi:glycosyltransferase involved in cell wall biosynthesis